MTRTRIPGRAIWALVKRPDLWRAAAVMIPPRWWRHWPPTAPWPPADYVHFRLETMYGRDGGDISPDELVAYLEWCRSMRVRAR